MNHAAPPKMAIQSSKVKHLHYIKVDQGAYTGQRATTLSGTSVKATPLDCGANDHLP